MEASLAYSDRYVLISSQKHYVLETHALQMSNHNVCFYEEIRQNKSFLVEKKKKKKKKNKKKKLVYSSG